MSAPSPIPETGTVRSDSAASTRDSASLLAELASQAIVLLQRADPHTVVTGLLKEKSYLHTQNGQLWRLVDKQRAALLELQKDYQKVLLDKNKYQARLKALQRQDGIRPFDQNSNSTESSSLAVQDLDTSQDANKTPSRRSSARSTRSRPPRSPQPNSQLDALQASLEAEIAKSSDEAESGSPGSASEPSNQEETTVLPSIVNSSSSTSLSSRGKKIPTPLDLSPAKIRVVDVMPRSAYLVPRGDASDRSGRLTPTREPPPSAPSYQVSNTNYLTAERKETPPLRSPGLPKSPRPTITQPLPLTPAGGSGAFAEFEEPEQWSQEPGPPSSAQELKAGKDVEEISDSSSSPNTSPRERDVLVETARKSPLVPRRSRMPSHRANNSVSHTSTSSSIITISGPTPTAATAPIVTKTSRSFSLEDRQTNGRPQGTLVPPEQSNERRKSRSFDDLQSLVQEMKTDSISTMVKSKSSNASLEGIGLDEAISEMRRENAQDKAENREESNPSDLSITPQPSPPAASTSQSTTALQPPFTAQSRSSSNVVNPTKLVISPSDIPSVVLSVLSVRSRQKTSMPTPGEETLFTVRCRVRNTVDKSLDREILRVEKPFSALTDLGSNLSGVVGMAQFLKSFFDDFPIEKADQRKAVDYFFGVVMGSQLDNRSLYAIAQFLSTDIVQKHDSQLLENRNSGVLDSSTSVKSPTRIEIPAGGFRDGTGPTKEGYLTKRGKNFGGWQTRYFVLDGPQLKYYDAPNGVHLGSIKLPQAQIGRQNSQAQTETDENGDEQMRYAFLILEPKRNDASKTVRHVLCSQTDEDRDEWINALLHYVAMDPEPSSETSEKAPRVGKRLQRRQDYDAITDSNGPANAPHPISSDTLASETEIIAIRYDQMPAGKRPMTATDEGRRQSSWPQPSHDDTRVAERLTRSPEQLRQAPPSVPSRSPYRGTISAPINGAPITDETAWNSIQREEERRKEEKRTKKRSVWGFLSKDNRGRSTPESIQATAPPPPALMQHGLFGIPLRDAVDITREMGMGINVPSVVYRCIEYLEHMDAAREEGIYRLSGSNSAIRMLKDRFNSEGDVDLANSKDYHDVHAVAGLLKLYLRELPSTVLTRERHVDFLHIVDIEDKSARVRRLSELVHALPKVNYELLRIMSKHLKRIVRCSQENKMTIRNVGIVFSPTLNIPAPVFSLFITEYEVVFDEPDSTPDSTTPPAAVDPPSNIPPNENQNATPATYSNTLLAVQDHPSHRRKYSNEASGRPSTSQGRPSTSQMPASFPMHNQGQRDATYLQQPHQQQIYPQQSYYQQSHQHYSAQQPAFQRQRTQDDEDTSLFG